MHKESMFFYNLKITLSFNIAGGLVIGTVVYFFIKNIELSDLLQEQEAMNEQLSTSKAPLSKPDEGVITLSGKTKDLITLNPENILYIESSGNYANIYFLEDGKASRRTLRATIQQMEDSLRDYPAIMRSHRAYIVNTSHIERVINSNHQFLLVLKTIDKEIPVSRTYKKNIPSYSRKTTPFYPVFL
jgi:DNA-binding LytR/AlgR family response regulator